MGKGRLEAFSDGVLAIIITIMVLELHAPHETDIAALRPLLPVLLSYVLSFVFLGIYWNNHHHMLHLHPPSDGGHSLGQPAPALLAVAGAVCDGVDGRASLRLDPGALYGVVLLMAGIAYLILQRQILRSEGPESVLAVALGRDLKGKLSPLLCVMAIGAAFVHPGIAYACTCWSLSCG